MNKVNDFSKAKVGDKVWSLAYGEGVITDITICGKFPVVIQFQALDHLEDYTIDGKLYEEDVYPTLYRTQPTVTAPEPKDKVSVIKYITWLLTLQGDVVSTTSFDPPERNEFLQSLGRGDSIYKVLGTEKLEREFEV